MEVTHYPTIIYYAPNNRMYEFKGKQTIEALNSYIQKEKWKDNVKDGLLIPV